MLNSYSLFYLTLNQANIIAFLSEPSLIGSNASSSNSSCNCRNNLFPVFSALVSKHFTIDTIADMPIHQRQPSIIFKWSIGWPNAGGVALEA